MTETGQFIEYGPRETLSVFFKKEGNFVTVLNLSPSSMLLTKVFVRFLNSLKECAW